MNGLGDPLFFSSGTSLVLHRVGLISAIMAVDDHRWLR
jgi:hypothetical protein